MHDALLNATAPFHEFALVETNLTKLLEGHIKRREQAEADAERARQAAAKKAAQKTTKKKKQ